MDKVGYTDLEGSLRWIIKGENPTTKKRRKELKEYKRYKKYTYSDIEIKHATDDLLNIFTENKKSYLATGIRTFNLSLIKQHFNRCYKKENFSSYPELNLLLLERQLEKFSMLKKSKIIQKINYMIKSRDINIVCRQLFFILSLFLAFWLPLFFATQYYENIILEIASYIFFALVFLTFTVTFLVAHFYYEEILVNIDELVRSFPIHATYKNKEELSNLIDTEKDSKKQKGGIARSKKYYSWARETAEKLYKEQNHDYSKRTEIYEKIKEMIKKGDCPDESRYPSDVVFYRWLKKLKKNKP